MTLWGLLPVDENLMGEFEIRTLSTLMRSKNPSLIGKRGDCFLRLTDAHYNMTAPSLLQFFPLSPTVENLSLTFSILVLDVTSNWGANTTCLYSLGIYGETPNSNGVWTQLHSEKAQGLWGRRYGVAISWSNIHGTEHPAWGAGEFGTRRPKLGLHFVYELRFIKILQNFSGIPSLAP
ncbi:hypothetical protein BD779DRAFT_1482871 [Infundibulicybe gibba]|nr:hypothetical protein BD779DRAFT_1482871 [Infundibulicybe gibba]